jgi:hypothetical protein
LFSSFKYAILAVTKGNDMKNSEIYQIVTDRIISGLKLGKIAWKKTWRGGDIPKNFVTKKTYKGINVLILWYSMMINNYTMPYFLTFKQVSDLKGKVKKGSKSELIVYWQWIEGKEEKFNKVKNQWEKVKSGELNCFSFAGSADSVVLKALVKLPVSGEGETEESSAPEVESSSDENVSEEGGQIPEEPSTQ